ncbi:hypothetical protein ACA910_008791 [Epithemia clementina (nom. ined.)]
MQSSLNARRCSADSSIWCPTIINNEECDLLTTAEGVESGGLEVVDAYKARATKLDNINKMPTTQRVRIDSPHQRSQKAHGKHSTNRSSKTNRRTRTISPTRRSQKKIEQQQNSSSCHPNRARSLSPSRRRQNDAEPQLIMLSATKKTRTSTHSRQATTAKKQKQLQQQQPSMTRSLSPARRRRVTEYSPRQRSRSPTKHNGKQSTTTNNKTSSLPKGHPVNNKQPIVSVNMRSSSLSDEKQLAQQPPTTSKRKIVKKQPSKRPTVESKIRSSSPSRQKGAVRPFTNSKQLTADKPSKSASSPRNASANEQQQFRSFKTNTAASPATARPSDSIVHAGTETSNSTGFFKGQQRRQQQHSQDRAPARVSRYSVVHQENDSCFEITNGASSRLSPSSSSSAKSQEFREELKLQAFSEPKDLSAANDVATPDDHLHLELSNSNRANIPPEDKTLGNERVSSQNGSKQIWEKNTAMGKWMTSTQILEDISAIVVMDRTSETCTNAAFFQSVRDASSFKSYVNATSFGSAVAPIEECAVDDPVEIRQVEETVDIVDHLRSQVGHPSASYEQEQTDQTSAVKEKISIVEQQELLGSSGISTTEAASVSEDQEPSQTALDRARSFFEFGKVNTPRDKPHLDEENPSFAAKRSQEMSRLEDSSRKSKPREANILAAKQFNQFLDAVLACSRNPDREKVSIDRAISKDSKVKDDEQNLNDSSAKETVMKSEELPARAMGQVTQISASTQQIGREKLDSTEDLVTNERKTVSTTDVQPHVVAKVQLDENEEKDVSERAEMQTRFLEAARATKENEATNFASNRNVPDANELMRRFQAGVQQMKTRVSEFHCSGAQPESSVMQSGELSMRLSNALELINAHVSKLDCRAKDSQHTDDLETPKEPSVAAEHSGKEDLPPYDQWSAEPSIEVTETGDPVATQSQLQDKDSLTAVTTKAKAMADENDITPTDLSMETARSRDILRVPQELAEASAIDQNGQNLASQAQENIERVQKDNDDRDLFFAVFACCGINTHLGGEAKERNQAGATSTINQQMVEGLDLGNLASKSKDDSKRLEGFDDNGSKKDASLDLRNILLPIFHLAARGAENARTETVKEPHLGDAQLWAPEKTKITTALPVGTKQPPETKQMEYQETREVSEEGYFLEAEMEILGETDLSSEEVVLSNKKMDISNKEVDLSNEEVDLSNKVEHSEENMELLEENVEFLEEEFLEENVELLEENVDRSEETLELTKDGKLAEDAKLSKGAGRSKKVGLSNDASAALKDRKLEREATKKTTSATTKNSKRQLPGRRRLIPNVFSLAKDKKKQADQSDAKFKDFPTPPVGTMLKEVIQDRTKDDTSLSVSLTAPQKQNLIFVVRNESKQLTRAAETGIIENKSQEASEDTKKSTTKMQEAKLDVQEVATASQEGSVTKVTKSTSEQSQNDSSKNESFPSSADECLAPTDRCEIQYCQIAPDEIGSTAEKSKSTGNSILHDDAEQNRDNADIVEHFILADEPLVHRASSNMEGPVEPTFEKDSEFKFGARLDEFLLSKSGERSADSSKESMRVLPGGGRQTSTKYDTNRRPYPIAEIPIEEESETESGDSPTPADDTSSVDVLDDLSRSERPRRARGKVTKAKKRDVVEGKMTIETDTKTPSALTVRILNLTASDSESDCGPRQAGAESVTTSKSSKTSNKTDISSSDDTESSSASLLAESYYTKGSSNRSDGQERFVRPRWQRIRTPYSDDLESHDDTVSQLTPMDTGLWGNKMADSENAIWGSFMGRTKKGTRRLLSRNG